MTRDEFVNHVLAACGCEFRDGKIWFEKEELIECADDLYFKNPKYQSEDCIKFPKGTLKKRGKGYVAYNYAWLKENWQTELKAMGIDWKE